MRSFAKIATTAAIIAGFVGLVAIGNAQEKTSPTSAQTNGETRPAVKPGWKKLSKCTWWQGAGAELAVTKAIIPMIKRPWDTKLSASGGWSYPRKTTRVGCTYTINAVFPTTNKYGVKIRGSYKATATLDKDTGYWTVEILELNQGGMFE